MDMYDEYCSVMQEEAIYDRDWEFGYSMDFEYCECGALLNKCPTAYEHMSRGY